MWASTMESLEVEVNPLEYVEADKEIQDNWLGGVLLEALGPKLASPMGSSEVVAGPLEYQAAGMVILAD